GALGAVAPVLPARAPAAPVLERGLHRVPRAVGRQPVARRVQVGALRVPLAAGGGDLERMGRRHGPMNLKPGAGAQSAARPSADVRIAVPRVARLSVVSKSMNLPGPLLVSAADIVRVYGEGEASVRALDGVTVGFPKGRFTAIMGASGSGKSTLMHILAGLDRPTSGSVV